MLSGLRVLWAWVSPSASSFSGPWRRHCAGRRKLDRLPARIFSCRSGCCRGCSGDCSCSYLEKAFAAGELNFFSAHRHLHEPAAFRRYLAPAWNAEWVVYAKRPFAGPAQVLDYVGRYTHRVAISNNRLVSMDDGKVRFRWKDYRDDNRQKTMTLQAEEFIRRFLIHVLPGGFHRIRYYGFLGNRYRKDKLARCRELIGMSKLEPKAAAADKDYRATYETLTGVSLYQCPVCHRGHMVLFRALQPITRVRVPIIIDTS